MKPHAAGSHPNSTPNPRRDRRCQRKLRQHPFPDACACEPLPVFRTGGRHLFWTLALVNVLTIGLLLCSLTTHGAVQSVAGVGLTVNDLQQARDFYVRVLGFNEVAQHKAGGREEAALLGLRSARTRTATLQLGNERIFLTEHLGAKGRPIPVDSRSFDHWFQHIAIVVSDMERAYAHLRAHGVKHVSTAPQTLPAWNPAAGGIKAFYFRDPEDHVLEVIWFPPGKGDTKWQVQTTNLFLGIDHTAIVVSDTERSLEFYRDTLGMRVAGTSENHGVEQEHLNQVFGARVRITALRAPSGPGIEFLEYLTPPGGRPMPSGTRANDLIFWRTHLIMDDLNAVMQPRVRWVSRSVSTGSGAGRTFIMRDPDGHALQATGSPSAQTATR